MSIFESSSCLIVVGFILSMAGGGIGGGGIPATPLEALAPLDGELVSSGESWSKERNWKSSSIGMYGASISKSKSVS